MLLQQGRVKQVLELEQDLSVATRKARDEASDPRSGPLAVEQALDQVLRNDNNSVRTNHQYNT